MSAALRRLRRILLVIPHVWRAERDGKPGLSLRQAMALGGARSEEEVRRDVEALEEGVSLLPSAPDTLHVTVEGDRLRVDDAMRFARPPPLSLAEGAVLAAALRPFERDGGRAVQSALRKLRRATPEHLRAQADALARATDLSTSPPGEWASALEDAIARRVEIEIDYRAESTGTLARRVLEPRVLFSRDRDWYLAAWNVEKGEEHLYRLDRIVAVRPGDRVFGEHRGPPVSRYARGPLYLDSGRERRVRIRFTGAAVRAARERWPAAVERAPDGSATLETSATPGNYLYGWVLGFGGDADIVAPADVAERFRQRVDALRALYG
ncbi:MAG TPA: WYL domain-containing protein [Anaeromyxobacteraceae bacterium]|nr:WYL domain-containing protein [Anaeromyxobacteraceae bacterium]